MNDAVIFGSTRRWSAAKWSSTSFGRAGPPSSVSFTLDLETASAEAFEKALDLTPAQKEAVQALMNERERQKSQARELLEAALQGILSPEQRARHWQMQLHRSIERHPSNLEERNPDRY